MLLLLLAYAGVCQVIGGVLMGTLQAQEILDFLPDAVILVDRAGQIRYLNGQAVALFGYTAAEVVGQPVEVLLPTRFQSGHAHLRQNYVDNPYFRVSGEKFNLWGRCRDGREFVADIRLRPLGELVICVIHDITDRKRAEEALHLSEARYRALFEQANDAILVSNARGQIVDVNQRAADLLGYTQEELLQQSLADLYAPDVPYLLDILGEPYETVYLHRSGARVLVEVNLARLTGNGDALTLAVVRDITRRKEVEEALRESEERLRRLVDHSPIPILVTNMALEVTYLNARFTALFGYRLADLPTLTAWCLLAFPDAAYRQQVEARWAEVLPGRGENPPHPSLQELQVVCRDGITRVVALSLINIGNRLLLTGYDLTDWKQVELAQRRYARQLEVLQQVGLELAAQLEPDMLLQFIVQHAIDLLDADAGGLYLYRPEEDVIEWVTLLGMNLAPAGARLKKGEGISGKVWELREPIIVHDYQQWANKAAIFDGLEWASVLAVPIHWGDSFLGVIDVLANTTHAFSAEDARLLSLFATQAAVALENARLFQAQHEARLQAETLAEVSLSLTTHTDPSDVLDDILQQSRRIIAYNSANIALLEEDQLHIVRWVGYEAYDARGLSDLIYQPLTVAPLAIRAMNSGLPVLVEDVRKDPDWVRHPTTQWVRSFLCVPIYLHDRVVGFLRFEGEHVDQFSLADAQRLQPLVNAAAITLSNTQLLLEMQQRNRELFTLYRISEIMLTAPSLEEAFQAIVEEISLVTDFRPVAIEEYDELHQTMILRGSTGMVGGETSPAAEYAAYQAYRALSMAVARSGEPLLVSDLATRPGPDHEQLRQLQVRTYVCVPMWSNQKVIGTLSLASATEKTVEDQFMNWITSAANYIAAFIARKKVEDAMLEAQKLESLGVLASGVAHDFNNLLAGILAESALALNKLDFLSPARQNLAHVVQTTRRAADLTGQLLAYSGRGHLQMRLLDLNALVQENLTLLQTSVPRSVTLNTQLMPNLPPVKADMGQMQQVIMNLIINAAEAYEGQPGTVWLRTGTIIVDAKYQTSRVLGQGLPPGRYVSLVVEDKAKGMTEDVLARIFDPFFTTKFTGRGLGLAAVLGVIRGHSGDINVVSQVGQGTTFQVLLPAARQVPAARPVPAARQEPTAGALPPVTAMPTPERPRASTILLVDDELVLREALSELLEVHGFTVLLAENGLQGLAVYDEYKADIDLILLDMTMPVMSGRETLAALKQRGARTPVLLLSGYDPHEMELPVEGITPAGFLRKPFELNVLLATIRQVLDAGGGI